MSNDIKFESIEEIDFSIRADVQKKMDRATAEVGADFAIASTLSTGQILDRDTVATELETTGTSKDIQNAIIQDQIDRDKVLVNDAVETARDEEMSQAEKELAISDIQTVFSEEGEPRDILEVTAKKMASVPATPGQVDVERAHLVTERILNHSMLKDQFQEDIAKALFAKFGEETYEIYEAAFEAGGIIVPFEFGDKIADWYEKFTGKDAGFIKRLLPGEVVHELKTILSNERTAAGKRAMFQSMLESLKNVDGLFHADSSKMSFIFLANAIADPDFTPGEDFDWDRLIENSANLLDITLVGGSLLRTGRSPFRVLGLVNAVNPTLGDKMYQRILRSRQAKDLGINPTETIVRSHTPSANNAEDVVDGTPTEILHEIDKTEKALQRMIEKGQDTVESQAHTSRDITITNRIDALGFGDIHVARTKARNLNEAQVKKLNRTDEQGNAHNVEYSVMLGRDRVTGFDDMAEVQDYLKANGVEGDYTLMVKSLGKYKKLKKQKVKGTNKWRYPVEKGEDGKLRFKGLEDGDEIFIRYNTTDYVPAESSMLNFDNMNPSKTLSLINQASKSRLLWDVYSLFGKSDAFKLGSVSDINDAATAVIKRANDHFESLSVGSKNNVLKHLRELSLDEAAGSTYADLVLEGMPGMKSLTNQEYTALKNIQLINNIQHHVTDTKIAKQMQDMNMRQLETADGTFIYGGKVDPTSPSWASFDSVKEVSDLKTGKPLAVDAKLKRLIKEGKVELYKIRGKESVTETASIGRGEEAYLTDRIHKMNYAIVNKEALPQVRRVPDQGVVPKINNYLHRDYEGTWFIEKIDNRTIVDGKPVHVGRVDVGDFSQDASTVVGFTERRSQTKQLIDEMRANLSADELKHIQFRPRVGREIMETAGDDGLFEIVKQSGLLNKGKRGKLLPSIGKDTGNLRPVSTALQRSWARLGREVATEDMVQMAKESFVRKFGRSGLNMLRDTDKGMPQVFPSSLPKGTDTTLSKEYNDMQVAWEYIDFLSGMERSAWRKNARRASAGVADWLDMKGIESRALHGINEGFWKATDLGWARMIPFTSAIVGNPLRQLLMQASQHSALWAIDPKFFASGKAYEHAAALRHGAAVRHMPDFASAAKLLKREDQTVEEFTEAVDDILDSGIFESINSHHYIEGASMLHFEGGGRAWETVAGVQEAGRNLFRAVKKVGFDTGELYNLSVTRALAEHTLKKGGNPYTKADVNELSRAWALGMNKAGKFSHQDIPVLQLFTQFMSFQQKAFATLVRGLGPTKRLGGLKGFTTGGNKAFTPEQARRIALVQYTNFGTFGLGVSWAGNGLWDMIEQETGEVIPQPIREASVYGISNYLMNLGLQGAYEEQQLPRINFGSTFAPFSGYTFITESVYDAFMGDEPSLTAILGATGMYLRKIDKGVDNMAKAFSMVDPNDQQEVEAVQLMALNNFASIMSSGISNYYKVEMNNGANYLKDSAGSRVVQLSAAEALSKKYLGVEIMSGHYEIKQDINKRKKEAWNEGRRIVNVARGLMEDDPNKSPIDIFQRVMAHIQTFEDPLERGLVRQAAVRTLHQDALAGDTQAQRLITMFATQGIGSREALSSELLKLASTPAERALIQRYLDLAFSNPEMFDRGVELNEEQQ